MTLVAANGMNYLRVLRQLHRRLTPGWYLEIGTFTGDSLALSHTRSVAIDPQFKVRSNVLRGKPQCFFLQQESDAAFESGVMDALNTRFDLAFLDGLHLYEFLLRDFMNAERYATDEAVYLLHDCLPFNENMTVRDRDQCETAEWTGDVWKLLPILREYRPDLKVTALDAAPTGLVAIQNMDPGNTVLWDKYDEITARFDALDITAFGTDRFTDVADVQSASDFVAGFSPPAPTLSFAIKIATPPQRPGEVWGEHLYAQGIAAALERLGHPARVDVIDQWDRVGSPDEVDLVLRCHGYRKKVYIPSGDRKALMWSIYAAWPEMTEQEISAFDHIWSASLSAEPIVGARSFGRLPQAFDAERMKPVDEPARDRIVYVASNYERAGRLRTMAQLALEAGLELSVWGKGWEATELAPYVVASHLPPEELSEVYANALAVLNDHANGMGPMGYVSNRIFDALACGAPVISDPVAGLPKEFAPFVHQVEDASALKSAVAEISSEGVNRRAARRMFAKTMRDTHSFDARAADIVARALQSATEAPLRETV